MEHPLGRIELLVPARDAADPEQLRRLQAKLDERQLDWAVTALPKNGAGEAIRALVAGGARFVVHCGGQRSLLDVVPALLDGDEWRDGVVLGVFPGGAPNDFARTFGLNANPGAAAELLASPRVMTVDVGKATLRGKGRGPAGPGGEVTAYVLNEAVVGLGATVARKDRRSRLGRLLAWWGSVARYRPPAFDVDMTFAEWHAPATEVRLMNGQFTHDGLPVAPQALPDDGAWDVQVWDGPKHLPFTLQPAMPHGEHLPHEHIAHWRQKRAVVDATPAAPVAIDGRYAGTTPATFELLPKVLRLKI